jgi:hypothetical protein
MIDQLQLPRAVPLHFLSYWAFPHLMRQILMFELNLQQEIQVRMHEFNQL